MAMQNWKKWISKKWKLILVILILGGVGWAWYANQNKPAEEDYVVQQPRKGDLIKTINISGHIDAEEKVRMRYLSGGKIIYLGVQEGKAVKKGQIIATVDQAILQKQLKKDLNNYMQERTDYEQFRDDVVENGDEIPDIPPDTETERDINRAQWALENSVLDVEIRSLTINDTNLVSPFNGIVTFMPTQSVGTQVSPTDYFEVVNPETLVFKADVDEEDIGQVRIGQSGALSLDAFADKSIITTVSYIPFTSTSSSTGTVYVIELPLAQAYTNYPLRLGMSGDVDIEVDRVTNALSVPIEAIRQRDNTTYVDVLENGEKKERVVVTGLETDDEVEITRGVTETDQVVIPQ